MSTQAGHAKSFEMACQAPEIQSSVLFRATLPEEDKLGCREVKI